MKNLLIVKGVNKNGQVYYALKITHVYKSGKSYTEMVFINESTYQSLLNEPIYQEMIISEK